MIKINSIYFGINSEEELIQKIASYLSDYSEWNYESEDWANEEFPRWTFSGSVNGDILTSHVQKCCLYGVDYEYYDNEEWSTENAWLSDFSFSDEEDRLNQCAKFATKIAETIELD